MVLWVLKGFEWGAEEALRVGKGRWRRNGLCFSREGQLSMGDSQPPLLLPVGVVS